MRGCEEVAFQRPDAEGCVCKGCTHVEMEAAGSELCSSALWKILVLLIQFPQIAIIEAEVSRQPALKEEP